MRLLLALVLLTGCAHRIKTDQVLTRDGYSILRLEGGRWAVQATSPAALERARREIGCGVCADEVVMVHVIEKR